MKRKVYLANIKSKWKVVSFWDYLKHKYKGTAVRIDVYKWPIFLD